MMVFMGVPLAIFMLVVAPLWLFLHYSSKRRTVQGLSASDLERLQALVEQSERLQDRITTLEKLLDQEAPGWRNER